MKKLLIPCLLISFMGFGQNKIDGLGNFKIGKTLQSTITWDADTTRLYYAFPEDSVSDMWIAKEYFIAGIKIEDLKLKFYKDTLYSIECNSSDSLIEALEAKYGQPVIKTKEKVIHCITGLKINCEHFSFYISL